jgi:hypothetical protein
MKTYGLDRIYELDIKVPVSKKKNMMPKKHSKTHSELFHPTNKSQKKFY